LANFVTMNPGSTYATQKGALSGNPTCQACVFGNEAAPTWSPFVENANGTLRTINVGGCIAIASGNDNCGKAYQQWFECGFEACADCAPGDQVRQTCRINANKGACKTALMNVGAVCGDVEIGDAETVCQGVSYIFEGPIKAQCIGGIP
jgi:hypothetical protein